MTVANCVAPVLAASVWLASASASAAEVPDWRAFRTSDGSFVVEVGGDITDPYFVNKSMIVAMEAGLDVKVELRSWLNWLLPRQRRDGGFDRYCGARSGHWVACLPADADDSTAATTLHMLKLARDRNWISAKDAQRAHVAEMAAEGLLRSLRDDGNGLYRVFAQQPTYYLMDNVEVYEALKLRKDSASAPLGRAIHKQFRRGQLWEPSIPPMDRESFYPHALARSYLWHSGLLEPAESGADIAAWLAHFSGTWLERKADHFAWGIVAWNIHRLAPAEAACWRQSVRVSQGEVGWTMLDAVADAALAHKAIPIACARALATAAPPASEAMAREG